LEFERTNIKSIGWSYAGDNFEGAGIDRPTTMEIE